MFPVPIESVDEVLRKVPELMLSKKEWRLERRLRASDVTDGLSNTFMMTEVAGAPQHWTMGRREGYEPLESAWADPRIVLEVNGFGSEDCVMQCTNDNEIFWVFRQICGWFYGVPPLREGIRDLLSGSGERVRPFAPCPLVGLKRLRHHG